MSDSRQKVLLITGAASGIGAATARQAIKAGDKVAIADIDAAGAQALARELGERALAITLDVRSPDQWNACLDATWQHFGRLDVLINNAGIVHTGYTRDVTIEQHRRTVEINFMGPMYGMTLALPRFQDQGSGHLLTVCSMTSFLPMPGMASYAGTKHALRAFHHSLALEERHGPLHFTIIHPPSTETAMLEQELRDDSAVLAFTEKSVTADFVAQTILRAIETRPHEVVMPWAFGRFLRMFGANTSIMRRMIDGAEKKGRRLQAIRRAKNQDR
ncbi:MAG: SDR family oxidoreductase [Rhodanobacter sp.]